MARAIIYYYDANEERYRRKRLTGENMSHEIKEGFIELKVDGQIFIYKEEDVKSVNIIHKD